MFVIIAIKSLPAWKANNAVEVASQTAVNTKLMFWMHLTNRTYIGGVFDSLN